MKNQYLNMPDYLRPDFEAANEELRIASEVLNNANRRLAAAVLSRIDQTNDIVEAELRIAKDEANDAGKRYNDAVTARVEVSTKINDALREQRWAS